MLADTIGAQLSSLLGSVIDTIMTGIWVAAVGMLRGAFQLVDTFTTVDFVGVDTVTVGIDGAARPLSPLGAVWPVLRWLSLAIAVGLFFVQLAATMLRGGRGLFRLVTGPFAYAVAVAMTAGGITLLFAAADGLTTVLLQQGLRADGFVGVLDSDAAQAVFSPAPTLDPVDPGPGRPRGAEATSQFDATARAVTLGVVALVGVIPASFGFALESVFRLAAFLVLVATSPISAAGLLSDATAAWYWRGLRWAVAAAVMKPALALVLVVGVNVLSAPTGVAGLIAGAGVLLVALFAPFTVYRLLAFVDPGTNAGAAARANFSRLSQRGSSDGGQGEAGSAVAAAVAAAGPRRRTRPGSTPPAPAAGQAGPPVPVRPAAAQRVAVPVRPVAAVPVRLAPRAVLRSPGWRWLPRPASSRAGTPGRPWTRRRSGTRTAAAAGHPRRPAARRRDRWARLPRRPRAHRRPGRRRRPG